MKSNHISRRGFLHALALGAGAAVGTRIAGDGFFGTARAAGERSVLLAIHFDGGYNALFSSADSFQNKLFGVNDGNVMPLGNGLVVDRATLGSAPQFARSHMASIGVDHHTTDHEFAQYTLWMDSNEKSYPLRLAAAMGGDGSIKAAQLGRNLTFVKDPPAEGALSMQRINDMQATIEALGGGTPNPKVPTREIAASGLAAAEAMSKARLAQSPKSLVTMRDGFTTAVDTLKKPPKKIVFGDIATAYGQPANRTSIDDDIRSKLVAAELMIYAGANVISLADGGGLGWDTHGARPDASNDRNTMEQDVMPALNIFLSRMMNQPDLNVVVALMGDFSRSPSADHARNLTATVMGKYVKVGTTGRTNDSVELPSGTPGVQQFWSYLASVLKVPTNPFGQNPHALVL